MALLVNKNPEILSRKDICFVWVLLSYCLIIIIIVIIMFIYLFSQTKALHGTGFYCLPFTTHYVPPIL